MRALTLDFVLATNSSFSITENKEFKSLIEYVSNSNAKIPTSKTLMKDMDSQYISMKSKLIETIEKTSDVCTTADIWTNKGRSYMGVSIHFFDKDLEKKSFLLAFRRMRGRHTYSAIANLLLAINKEFHIKRSIITHIITDGASNFKKAFHVYGDQTEQPNTI